MTKSSLDSVGTEYTWYSPAPINLLLIFTSSENEIVVGLFAPVLQILLNGTNPPKIFLPFLEGLE